MLDRLVERGLALLLEQHLLIKQRGGWGRNSVVRSEDAGGACGGARRLSRRGTFLANRRFGSRKLPAKQKSPASGTDAMEGLLAVGAKDG